MFFGLLYELLVYELFYYLMMFSRENGISFEIFCYKTENFSDKIVHETEYYQQLLKFLSQWLKNWFFHSST